MNAVLTDHGRAARTPRPIARIGAAAGAVALVAMTAACGPSDAGLPEAESTEPAVTAAPTTRDVDAWLDGSVPAALEGNGIAGATVAVVHDGKVVTTRGFGRADTGEGGTDPVDVDAGTLFRAGSVSKVFTATAVMQLVEHGELDLDTDVSEYLDFDVERSFEDDLTLRHLLTHTPGFEERLAGLIGEGTGPVDLRDALVTDPPEQVYAPGTVPAYSNYGNALAGYIVERVSGEPFEEYLERHVFEPLGMKSSSFRQPLPEKLQGLVSQGYVDSTGPAQPFEVVGTPPAGSLSVSAHDMARFMLAQLGAVPEQDLLLSDQTREEMYSPALTAESLGAFADGERMTLGLFQEDRNGHRIVGHGGDTQFFHSHLQLYPDDGAGIFVSVNSSGFDPVETHAMRTELLGEFADRFFPAGSEGATGDGATVDPETMRENAEQVAGTYIPSRGFHSTFLSALDLLQTYEVSARDDGRLAMDPDPGTQRPNVYEQVGEHVWQETDGSRRIAVRTKDGQVTGIAHDSAMSIRPLDGDRAAGLPILVVAVAILVLGLLAVPAGAIWRRLRRLPAPVRDGRRWRVLTRVGVASTLLAVVGWVAVVVGVMGLTEVPPAAIRGVQALQVIGALGIVPAILRLVDEVRRRVGWRPVTGTVVTLLALSAVMNFAIMFQLLSPNISY
ncbi:hypothetical protein GCM10028784_23110 [Myceligenerans cantabricum]